MIPPATSPSPFSSVDAAPLVRAELDPGDVANPQGRAVIGLQDDVLDVGDALQVTAPADHELELGELDRASAHIGVAGPDGLAQLAQGDALRAQAVRVDDDVVLLDEAANGGDLGHALCPRGPEADHPVLKRAQLRQGLLLGEDRVLVDPADAGRVRPKLGVTPGRQAPRCRVEVFEHAAARPVRVGAVLEDDVDERDAEEREAAHHLRLRHGQHGRGQRIGDLVLDHLRRLPRVLGVDDDLDIGEVRDGVERKGAQRVKARRHRENRADQDQHEIAGRPTDEARDHGRFSSAAAGVLAARHALEGGLEVAFRVDQEVGGGDDHAVALGHAVADLDIVAPAGAGLDLARLETALAFVDAGRPGARPCRSRRHQERR